MGSKLMVDSGSWVDEPRLKLGHRVPRNPARNEPSRSPSLVGASKLLLPNSASRGGSGWIDLVVRMIKTRPSCTAYTYFGGIGFATRRGPVHQPQLKGIEFRVAMHPAHCRRFPPRGGGVPCRKLGSILTPISTAA